MTKDTLEQLIAQAESLMEKIDGLHYWELEGLDNATLDNAMGAMARIASHAKESQSKFWTAIDKDI